MKIIPLPEGAFTIDKTKQFVPFDLEADDLPARPKGSLLVEIQPFVVVVGEDILLLDTGLGFRDPDGTLQIHRHLVQAGISPLDITKVLLSHLHKDHAGGATVKDPAVGQYVLSFPQATYYIQRREWEDARSKGLPSYIPEELSLLGSRDQVEFLEADRGSIGPRVQFEVTGGHTPYHQVFWIKEGGQTVFFGGDDAPQWNQMRGKFIAKYDFDGEKCMELRREWLAEGQRDHWTFLFYHDVSYPSILM